MASIEERRGRDGRITSHRVVWRFEGQKYTQAFDTREDAEQWVAILRAAQNDPERAERAALQAATSGPTLAEVAQVHINRLVDLTPHTIHTYEAMVRNHMARLSGLPVASITDLDVAEMVADMRAAGRSPKTIANVHGLLHAIMATAVKRGYRQGNPCEDTRLPRAVHRDDGMAFLTQDEFALVLRQLDPHFRPFALFLVSTGLRFSEATALTAEDFTEHGPTEFSVRVNKAWKRATDGTRRYIGPPKSARGVRTVGFGRELAAVIAPLIDAAAEDGGLVFRMKRGGALNSQSFNSKFWRPAVTRAQSQDGGGLRKSPRVHDLRHTFASWQIAAGTSLEALSRIMGHESVVTTTGVYVHLMPETRNAAAEASSAALRSVVGSVDPAGLEYTQPPAPLARR